MHDRANHQISEKPPQFALRTLLVGVTLCCMLFALMRVIGPLASSALIFFLLLVALHVAGNVIGTALVGMSRGRRDSIDDASLEPVDPSDDLSSRAPRYHSRPGVAVRPGRLGERSPIGWTVVALTLVGAALGGTLGGLGYHFLMRTTTAGLIVGSVSSAVLGGFFGFLSASFLNTILRAWRQALAETRTRAT